MALQGGATKPATLLLWLLMRLLTQQLHVRQAMKRRWM
jgi:hypothetical protein